MKRLLLALAFLALSVPAWPGVPTVNSSNSGTSGSDTTTHTVTMPATVNSGELLVAVLYTDCATSCSITWDNSTLGTWTQLMEDFGGAGNTPGAALYVKIADGTEDSGSLSITGTNETDVWATFSIGTWGGSIANDTDLVYQRQASVGCDPDPPSAADSFGTVDRLTMAGAGQDGGDISVSSYPTSYADNHIDESSGSGPGTNLGVATRAQTSVGSQDPGTFTMTGNCSNEEWLAFTLSVNGSGGAPAAPSNLMLLGVGP